MRSEKLDLIMLLAKEDDHVTVHCFDDITVVMVYIHCKNVPESIWVFLAKRENMVQMVCFRQVWII